MSYHYSKVAWNWSAIIRCSGSPDDSDFRDVNPLIQKSQSKCTNTGRKKSFGKDPIHPHNIDPKSMKSKTLSCSFADIFNENLSFVDCSGHFAHDMKSWSFPSGRCAVKLLNSNLNDKDVTFFLERLKYTSSTQFVLLDLRGNDKLSTDCLVNESNLWNESKEERITCFFVSDLTGLKNCMIDTLKYLIYESDKFFLLDNYEKKAMKDFVDLQMTLKTRPSITFIPSDKVERVSSKPIKKIAPPEFLLPSDAIFWVKLNGEEGLLVPSFKSYILYYNMKKFPELVITDHDGKVLEPISDGHLIIPKDLASKMDQMTIFDPKTKTTKQIKVFPTITEYNLRLSSVMTTNKLTQ